MTVMINLIKRNLKLFFRDRTSVFFSLLAVFIIIGLYVLFLGNMMAKNFKELLGDNARFAVDSWVMAGLLSVTSITTTMGALGTMLRIKQRKSQKIFHQPHLSARSLPAGILWVLL